MRAFRRGRGGARTRGVARRRAAHGRRERDGGGGARGVGRFAARAREPLERARNVCGGSRRDARAEHAELLAPDERAARFEQLAEQRARGGERRDEDAAARGGERGTLDRERVGVDPRPASVRGRALAPSAVVEPPRAAAVLRERRKAAK